MRTDIRNREDIIKGHKNYQRYLLVLLCLSALVAAVVTISLIEPAVTMSYTCGMEEHIHTESCYTLTCEQTTEEDGSEHIHSIDKGCYDTSVANCGMSEHVHNVDCEEKEESEEELLSEQEENQNVQTTAASDDVVSESTETTFISDGEEYEGTYSLQMTQSVMFAEGETTASTEATTTTTVGDSSFDVKLENKYGGQSGKNLSYEISIENTGSGDMPVANQKIDPTTYGYTSYSDYAQNFNNGDMMLEIIIPNEYVGYDGLTADCKCFCDYTKFVDGVEKESNLTRTGRLIKKSENHLAFVFPLEPLKAKEKYVIKNDAIIKNIANATSKELNVGNIVKIRYLNADGTVSEPVTFDSTGSGWTAQANLSVNFNPDGCNYDSSGRVVNWSYTIDNPDQLDLRNLVIQDDNLKIPNTTSIQPIIPEILDASGVQVVDISTIGTLDSTKGTFTFKNDTNECVRYTFKYSLSDETRAGSNITVVTVKSTRDAVLAKGTSEAITVPSRIEHWATIESYDPTTKTAYARFVYNFMFPKQDVNGKDFKCVFATGRYDLNSIGEPVIDSINVMFSDGNYTAKIENKNNQEEYTVDWNSRQYMLTVKIADHGLSYDFDEGVRRIWVGVSVPLTAGELGTQYGRSSVDFTGTYQSYSTLSNLFTGTSTPVDNIVTTVSIGKQYKLYDKLDTSISDENATTHQYSDIDGVLRWYIDGNYGTKYGSSEDVPFKITLPEGLTYVDDAKLYVKDSDGNLTEQTSVLRKDISVNKREITLTIPASSAVLTGNSEFVIDFGAKAPVTGEDKAYEVSVVNFEDTHKQTQTITPSVISKSSSQEFFYAKDDGSGNWVKCEPTDGGAQLTGSRKADYELQINPKEQTLNDGKKITVVDWLKYQGDSNEEWYPEYIANSIEVYKVSGGTQTLLDKSEYGLTLMNFSYHPGLAGDSAEKYGLKMTLTLEDKTSYIVKYSYHLVIKKAQSEYSISNIENIAKILDSSGAELGRAVLKSNFKCNYYLDDLASDYASVRAIDVENGGKAVPDCVMMLLKYNSSTGGWSYYKGTADGDTSIDANWSGDKFIEISDLISADDKVDPYTTYQGKFTEFVTDSNGYVKLPVLQAGTGSDPSTKPYYRIVEIKPATGYQVNAEKLYSAAIIDNGGITVNTLPLRVNPENLTNIRDINGSQYGTVYVENTPIKTRTVNWSKEWIDDKTTHDDVTFDVYSSHKVYSTQSVKNVSLTFSKDGRSVYKSANVLYGGRVHFKIDGLAFASQPSYEIFVNNGGEIMETGQGDATSGYSSKYFGAQNLYTSYFSDGTVVYLRRWQSDTYPVVEVWCNCVKKDIIINFTANMNVQNTFIWSNDSIKVTGDVASGTEDNDEKDFDSLKTDGTKVTENQITLSDSDNWIGSITDVPTTDPYGYNLYYYVLEDPKINIVPGYGDYEVRYVNNGGAKLDENGDVIESEITVINKLTGYIKALPSTGGIGTNVYVDIGAAVILCGVLGCIIKKRPRKYRKGGS